MAFLDRRQAGDQMLAEQGGRISDRLLAGEELLVRDNSADLAHSTDRVGSLLVAPVAMAEHVEHLQRASMRNPYAKGTVMTQRVLGDCCEEKGEGLQVGHIAAYGIQANQDIGLAAEAAECDRLDLFLGNDLDRGDADGRARVGRKAAGASDRNRPAVLAGGDAVHSLVKGVHATLAI